MSKFLTGSELTKTVEEIIWSAKNSLIIVSPFIRLDEHYKDVFKEKLKTPEVHILIVFGKNEGKIEKSFSLSDFKFFKEFPNISIVYLPDLHAKYYANESSGVITSLNLHDYSAINNIEYGVYFENNVLTNLTGNNDMQAYKYSLEVSKNGVVGFIRRPVYVKKMLVTKKFIGSKTLFDEMNSIYKGGFKPSKIPWIDFPDLVLESTLDIMPEREIVQKTGFCIRTGAEIPFNPDKPMSNEAWKIWSRFKNMDYPESYCHKTGKPSNGLTSMKKPIL